MTVLLDTDLVAEHDRVDALHAAYDAQSPRRAVGVGSGRVRHRVEQLGLGPGLQLLRTSGNALLVERTSRHVRVDAPEHIAIGLHRRGGGLVSTADAEAELAVGHLNVVDMTRPYRLVHTTANDHDVLIVSNQQMGVSVDVVRAAQVALARSPVYPLLRGHVAGLWHATSSLHSETRRLTGQATTALVRALLTTAAGSATGADAMSDALETRISLYLDAHLSDRDLTVEGVAAAHNISVRHLYNVWARAGHDQTPAQWILDRRLERARELLETTPPSRAGIAAVARRSGFSDSSHFSRRFREAFGSSPRDWRSAHQLDRRTSPLPASRPGRPGRPG